jgi:hypothetical protein
MVCGCDKKSGTSKSIESQQFKKDQNVEENKLSLASSKIQEEDVYWQKISSSSSINDFQDYLDEFSGNGKYATQAMTKMQEIEWDKAKSKNSIKGYKRFLKLHPNSPYRNDCCSSISAIYAEYAKRIKEDAEVMSSIQIAPVSGLMKYNDDGSINYPQGTMLTYAVTGDISATFNGRFITTINDLSYFKSTSYESIILMVIGDSKVLFQFLDYPELPEDENAANWISLKYCTMESYVKGATEDASKGIQKGFDYLSTEVHPDTIPALQKLMDSTDNAISVKAKKALETFIEFQNKLVQ